MKVWFLSENGYNETMKILITTDSFKGCMTSLEAGNAIAKGLLKADDSFKCKVLEIADGGEGTARAYANYKKAKEIQTAIKDAYGRPITASFYMDEKQTAYMDVASVIGLNMYPKNKRNPFLANSYGVGMLMKEAIRLGAKKIVIGLGGSCTNDGGLGILRCFGARFYDANRNELDAVPYSLKNIAFINKQQCHIPKHVEIIAACDVKNHFLGENGATYTYGKQKGIYPSQLQEMDQDMAHFRDKVQQTFHVDLNEKDGSGAAGGIGGLLLSLFHAKMQSGIDLCIEYADLEQKIQEADLVITGEGQCDGQSVYGKVCCGIGELAKSHKKDCLLFAGALSKGCMGMYEHGITAMFSTTRQVETFEKAIAHGEKNLEKLAFNVGNVLLINERNL